MVNKDRATGEIEVEVQSLTILNSARPMPFNLDDPAVSEDLRLKYRYLEMRRSGLVDNLRLRHRLTKIVRDALDGPLKEALSLLAEPGADGYRIALDGEL